MNTLLTLLVTGGRRFDKSRGGGSLCPPTRRALRRAIWHVALLQRFLGQHLTITYGVHKKKYLKNIRGPRSRSSNLKSVLGPWSFWKQPKSVFLAIGAIILIWDPQSWGTPPQAHWDTTFVFYNFFFVRWCIWSPEGLAIWPFFDFRAP